MSTSATALATALKNVGITIENESLFIAEMDAAKDKDRALENLAVKGNLKNISFIVNPSIDATTFQKDLTKVFLTFGFDGFTYQTFFSKLKA